MEVPNSLYLLVGSKSPNYDPTRQIEMLDLADRVKSTGYVAAEDLPYYLAASDVCLNLRYPTAGETSASLLRIMGAGVPVLVSRTGSFEELPDDAAGKVDVGDIEEEFDVEARELAILIDERVGPGISHRADTDPARIDEIVGIGFPGLCASCATKDDAECQRGGRRHFRERFVPVCVVHSGSSVCKVLSFQFLVLGMLRACRCGLS